MAEYSAVAIQTVATNSNVLLSNGSRCCKKGYVEHRDDSGVFFLKGITNQCRVTYKVSFGANIAIATGGGTVEPISIALTINGEPLGNATAIVTPATIATDYFNVFVSTFIDVPYGCCATISVENTSATDIDVQNANLIIERVC